VNIDVVPRVGHVGGGENVVSCSKVVVPSIPVVLQAGQAECRLGVVVTISRQTLLRNKKKPNATCNYAFLADTEIPAYSSAPVSTCNTFQDLPRLRETADNTERYIKRDIRVTYINTVKFN
jgi:hypothetical protein